MSRVDTKTYMSAQLEIKGGGSGVVITGSRVDLHLDAEEAREFAETLMTAAAETERVKQSEREARDEKRADKPHLPPPDGREDAESHKAGSHVKPTKEEDEDHEDHPKKKKKSHG